MASVQPDVINLDDLNNNEEDASVSGVGAGRKAGRTDGHTTGFDTRADEGSRLP